MTEYLVLCEPDQETGGTIYRCLQPRCEGIAVLHQDLAEHAREEHQDGPDDYKITEIEVGYDLTLDDPDQAKQLIKCRVCGKEVGRKAALYHAERDHKSTYVYVNLLA